MTVPGFDVRLLTLLRTEAEALGESVDEFVGRAVALRLVNSLGARRDPAFTAAVDQLIAAGLLPADPSEPHRQSVIDDPNRLHVLNETKLLDGAPSPALHGIINLVGEALSVPSAAICLVERARQFFVCGIGMSNPAAVPLDRSIAKYIVASGRALVLDDARADATLRTHPVVAEGSVVAYLGVPLTNEDGFTVGALCVWDRRPRQWTHDHVAILGDFAEVVSAQIF